MYGILLLGGCLVFIVARLIIWPVLQYFIDSNGLRRFPNMSFWSGVSDMPYMLESAKGYRCGMLAELHKEHPVIRIGPNSLSYCDARAIKVSRAA